MSIYIYTVKYVKSSFRWIHVPFKAEVSAFCKHEKLEQDIQHILSHSPRVAFFCCRDRGGKPWL